MRISEMSMPSSQGTKLDQYRIAAKGQMRVGHKAAGWAGFATAAGATLAMSGVAEASIIYSGTQNLPLSLTNLTNPIGGSTSQTLAINIDFKDDGENDVVVGLQLGILSQISDGARVLGGGAFIRGLGTTTANIAAFSATTATSIARPLQLSSGQAIGPGGSFGASASSAIVAQGDFQFAAVNGGVVTSATSVTGLWGLNVNGFLGVQFQKNGSDHYAWIRLNFEDRDGNGLADKLTVVDWAYESESGVGIEAGNVPEPTPLALLAAGAVGISSFRRKRKAATAA